MSKMFGLLLLVGILLTGDHSCVFKLSVFKIFCAGGGSCWDRYWQVALFSQSEFYTELRYELLKECVLNKRKK